MSEPATAMPPAICTRGLAKQYEQGKNDHTYFAKPGIDRDESAEQQHRESSADQHSSLARTHLSLDSIEGPHHEIGSRFLDALSWLLHSISPFR